MTTPAELKRKKSRQAKLSMGASTLGLAGGAALAGAAIVRKPAMFKPSAIANGVKNIKLKRPDLSTDASRSAFADKIKDNGYLLGGGAGAVGGIGGLNFASIQRDEAKMRQPRQVVLKKPRV